MKNIWGLGLNCYSHNASVSLLRNGELLFSSEEERFDRQKQSQAFPRQALIHALDYCGIQAQDLSYLGFYFDPKKEIYQNATHFLRYFPKSIELLNSPGGSQFGFFERLVKQLQLPGHLESDFGIDRKGFAYIEHHLAHAASAYYPSSFSDAAILTWDGRGESTTCLLAVGEGNKITKLREARVPHSIGHLYSAVTGHLGFKPFYDEWKVMGMSAYGTDRYLKEFSSLIEVSSDGLFKLDLSFFSFHFAGANRWVSEKFEKTFGPKRNSFEEISQHHFDLAFALQKTVENAGVQVARALSRLTSSKNLCMTGGVALNVLLNRRILEETRFENFFIQPVANDAGTSYGAALYQYHHNLHGSDRHNFTTPYLGMGYSDDAIEKALLEKCLIYSRPESIAQAAAEAICDDKVVGWFQGRQEIGPRALGNRSILANPRNPEMKNILNARVKRREHFRPFAPSVIEERCQDYFILPKQQSSPYMILAGSVKPEYAGKLPSVTHADGTARVHTVSKSVNPAYWELIDHVGKISGTYVVLNTSFNENEPIVTTPSEAIDCFLRTGFDVLAIGPFLVKKQLSI